MIVCTVFSPAASSAQTPLTPGSASSDDSGGSPLARNPMRSMAITPQSSAGGGLHDAAAVAAAIHPRSGGGSGSSSAAGLNPSSTPAPAVTSLTAAQRAHFPAGVPENAVLIGGQALPSSPPPRPSVLRTSVNSDPAPWPPSPVHVARHAADSAAFAAAASSPGPAHAQHGTHRSAEADGLFGSGKPRPTGALSPRSFYRPTALTSLPVGPVAELRAAAAGPDEPHTPDTKAPLAAARKGATPAGCCVTRSPPQTDQNRPMYAPLHEPIIPRVCSWQQTGDDITASCVVVLRERQRADH